MAGGSRKAWQRYLERMMRQCRHGRREQESLAAISREDDEAM